MRLLLVSLFGVRLGGYATLALLHSDSAACLCYMALALVEVVLLILLLRRVPEKDGQKPPDEVS